MAGQVERNTEGPDRGWSWVILFADFTVILILCGIYRASGTMLVALMDEFKISREEASRPLFMRQTFMDLAGIIAGLLGQSFGIRPITMAGALISTLGVSICYFTRSIHVITVSYGAICGFGNGLVSTLIPVIVSQYFVNYRVIAACLAHTGASFGFVLFPIVYKYLIFTYQLNGCFLLTGGIMLQLVISGALMRPPPWLKTARNVPESLENSNSLSNWSMEVLMSFKIVLTCPMLYVIAVTNIMFFFIKDMFFTIDVDFYHDNSIDDKQIKQMNIIFTMCDIAGSLCFGWIMDRKFLGKPQFIAICTAIMAAVFLTLPITKNYLLITSLSSLFATLIGSTTVVLLILPADYLASEILPIACGCINFSNGLIELTYSSLIGYFRDNLGSYSSLCVIMGTISAISSLIWSLEGYLMKTAKTTSYDQFA